MLAWLSVNWVTIVVLGVLCLILFGIVRGMVRDHRRGKSVTCGACSGDCAHCRAARAAQEERGKDRKITQTPSV